MRSLNFAPLSGDLSTRLRLASGYFVVTGAFTLLKTVAMATAVAAGAVPWGGRIMLLNFAINLTFGVLAYVVGRLLARCSRRAGIGAIALLALPLVELALGGRASHFDVFLSIFGLVVMFTVWDELHPVSDPA